MLMEVVEDGTIATLLVRQMSQPRANLYRDADALRWCVGIADAVAMLHSRSPQIIHRDIKAENIMLGTVDGKKRHTAKLTDFGLHVVVPTGQGGFVRKRSLCPRIRGPVTSLAKASSGTPLSEKIFHRWDDPAVLLTGVSPGPSLLERRYVSLPTALEGSHLQPAFSQPQQHLQQQQQQQGERSLSPEEVTVQTGQIVLDSGSAASDGGRRVLAMPKQLPVKSATPPQPTTSGQISPPASSCQLRRARTDFVPAALPNSKKEKGITHTLHAQHPDVQQQQQQQPFVALWPEGAEARDGCSKLYAAHVTSPFENQTPAEFVANPDTPLPTKVAALPAASDDCSAGARAAATTASTAAAAAAAATPSAAALFQAEAKAAAAGAAAQPEAAAAAAGAATSAAAAAASALAAPIPQPATATGVTSPAPAPAAAAAGQGSMADRPLQAEGGGVMGPARVPGAPYDFEAVFRLTGNTGSTVYMSPEMHRNQPYNEKTDVYR
ncbi:MAG: hypothetical protein WDW38_001865 [Sanguina aurantia]